MENQYKTLEIVERIPNSQVIHLCLNRPSKCNALSRDFFIEFPDALSKLDQNSNVNVIILVGAGDHFCSGIDLRTLHSVTDHSSSSDLGRFSERLRRDIKSFQEAITAIERCRKPVIAAINGACIGVGVDMSSACDIRFCTKDAFFQVKQVDLAVNADLGTLQRLLGIVGFGNAMELALTGRWFSGLEAKEFGLVSRVLRDKEDLDEAVRNVAEKIAAKSPLAVTGTKAVLLRSREMTVDQGLDYVATWNSAMLLSDDLVEAVSAQTHKRKAVFAKL